MTSRIEKIETEVMQLSAKELDAFRAWFADYNDAWHRQIEADSKAGKLDHLAATAMRDYEAGVNDGNLIHRTSSAFWKLYIGMSRHHNGRRGEVTCN